MDKYVVKKSEIDTFPGTAKQHFLNEDAIRTNKSLGDLTGLTGLGFHIIEVPVGKFSTEYHLHYFEDECTYVLSGSGTVTIGNEEHLVEAGDFIGYRAGGEAHTMQNTGDEMLRCIVVGQRLANDVGDFPNQGKRLFRNQGLEWNMVNIKSIEYPSGGAK